MINYTPHKTMYALTIINCVPYTEFLVRVYLDKWYQYSVQYMRPWKSIERIWINQNDAQPLLKHYIFKQFFWDLPSDPGSSNAETWQWPAEKSCNWGVPNVDYVMFKAYFWFCNCSQGNATGPYWWEVNIGSGHGGRSSGWRHYATSNYLN